ncbi:hypothetical protein C8R47DRAFT_1229579 [Mycena vitilis]|nr:hypothetical protein C8R47DRAFT_1229579 [Mycena vitilis]
MDDSQPVRMVAAQSCYSVASYEALAVDQVGTEPTPAKLEPSALFLDKFWRRVAQLTTRYHDVDRKWIGGEEIRKWNTDNRKACQKCATSRTMRVCIVDEDQPSCRACRTAKIGCDRKPQFVYDLTKAEFFSHYGDFLAVFRNREPGRLKRYERIVPLKKRKRPARDVGRSQTVHESVARRESKLDGTSETLDIIRDLLTNGMKSDVPSSNDKDLPHVRRPQERDGISDERLMECRRQLEQVERMLRQTVAEITPQ